MANTSDLKSDGSSSLEGSSPSLPTDELDHATLVYDILGPWMVEQGYDLSSPPRKTPSGLKVCSLLNVRAGIQICYDCSNPIEVIVYVPKDNTTKLLGDCYCRNCSGE